MAELGGMGGRLIVCYVRSHLRPFACQLTHALEAMPTVGVDRDEAQTDDAMQVEEASEGVQSVAAAEGAAAPEGDEGFASRLKHEGAAFWMRNCSKHLHNIEGRIMQNSLLGHEVVRQIIMIIQGFCPATRGDWGCFLRKCIGIGVKAVRHLVATYYGAGYLGKMMERATSVVRLYFEEAFHRLLYLTKKPLRKAAYCSILVWTRRLEADLLSSEYEGYGFFTTFTEDFVRRLGEKVLRNERITLADLPSIQSVMRAPEFRAEVYSLMAVTAAPGMIMMSRDEIKARIEATGSCLGDDECIEATGSRLGDDERTAGTEGPSVFRQAARADTPGKECPQA